MPCQTEIKFRGQRKDLRSSQTRVDTRRTQTHRADVAERCPVLLSKQNGALCLSSYYAICVCTLIIIIFRRVRFRGFRGRRSFNLTRLGYVTDFGRGGR